MSRQKHRFLSEKAGTINENTKIIIFCLNFNSYKLGAPCMRHRQTVEPGVPYGASLFATRNFIEKYIYKKK